MAILFVVELWAFLSTTIETGVMLDTNVETLPSRRAVVAVNFYTGVFVG